MRQYRSVRCLLSEQHEVVKISEPRRYTGSVNPWAEFPAAHGNITCTETCQCGASRNVNINGVHREEGLWTR